MHIEYEISEQDYLKGQRLAIKNHSRRSVRWMRLGLPTFGFILFVGYISNFVLVTIVLKQTFSSTSLLALLVPAFFVSTPLLNKRSQRKLYAQSTSLHGKLSLRADEDGFEGEGPTFHSKVNWSVFDFFCEDNASFVLFQKTLIISIIPKRELSADNIQELRRLFQSKISRS